MSLHDLALGLARLEYPGAESYRVESVELDGDTAHMRVSIRYWPVPVIAIECELANAPESKE